MGIKKVPLALKECKCLQELNFHDNQLQDLPSQFIIYYFPYLKILDVSKNCLSDLGQIGALNSMDNLEVLNIQGNQIPKSNARIEMLEYLLCSNHENDAISRRNFELGMKDNIFSVFLKMGTLTTVLSNFSDQLALCVKADEYIAKNGLENFDGKKYQLQTLSVDSFSLTNGSLFSAFEVVGQLYIRGPGFMLWKDRRVDAPFVLVGQINQSVLHEHAQSANSANVMNRMLGHTDALLELIKNSEMVPAEVARNGFFGRLFFVYQSPYKPDQYLGDQRLKLTTIELIKKSSMKDPKIDTNIPQAKLEALNVDLYKVMPSEIVKHAKKTFRMHHAYLSNMNDRDTTALVGHFQRLRMLNGKIITVDEMDKVMQLHQLKVTQAASAKSVAYMHCKTTIPQALKVQCESLTMKKSSHINQKQIGGMAGQDLKEATTKVTQTRPLSEVIRKQQIYNRLMETQRKERREALDDINRFLTSGELKKTDDNIGQLAVLLQAYDADKDGSLEEFLQECESLHQTYTQPEVSDVEGDNIKMQQTTTKQIVSSAMNATIASLKASGPFQDGSVVEPLGKTKIIRQKEQKTDQNSKLTEIDTSNVIQLTGTVLASANSPQRANLRMTDLNQTNSSPFDEEDKHYLQQLGATISAQPEYDTDDDFSNDANYALNPMLSGTQFEQSTTKETKIQQNKEQSQSFKMSIEDQQQIDQLQRSLQLAKQQNYDFEQSVRLMRADRGPQTHRFSAIIGARNADAPNADEAVVAKSTINLQDAEPMNVITRNLDVSINARRTRFPDAERSQIIKSQFQPETNALNLDNPAINYQTFANITTESALADTSKISSLKSKTSLAPDFRAVMAEEVRIQKEETDQLFQHIAQNVDKNVRKRLVTRQDQWQADGVKRHSALLDVVLEGDRLSGSPYGLKLQSKCTGPLSYQKKNEAQQILQSKNLPPPQPKRQTRSQDDALQYTSNDIMDFIDTSLTRQHLQFEWMRHTGNNNVADRGSLMKQLLRTNQKEIESARQRELLKKHKANIQLIKREAKLDTDKLNPQLALAAKEQRKLQYMRDKLYEQKKLQGERITNEQLKIQQLTDPETLNPIKIRSKALRKKFSADVVAPIQVETIEEAAYEANYMKVDAADLIYKSAAIMKTAHDDLQQLEKYSDDFIARQMAFDKQREDPMRHLLKTENFDDVMADVLAGMRQDKPQIETRTFDPASPIIKSVQATLSGKQTNAHGTVTSEFDKVVAEGEKLFAQVQDAIDDV